MVFEFERFTLSKKLSLALYCVSWDAAYLVLDDAERQFGKVDELERAVVENFDA